MIQTRTLVLLTLTTALAACSDAPESSGPPPAAEVAVVTLTAERLDVQTELPGRTSAYQLAEVRPQVTGILKQRLFKEGETVKAGTSLYQIDPASYQAAYQSAKGSLARAEALAKQAELKAKRADELAAIKAISQQELEDAQAGLAQAKADTAIARAAVETARINLDYTQVRAPITGRVGKSSFTPGALVTANQANLLTTVQQLDPIYVDLTQSSTEMLKLQNALASGRLTREGQVSVQLTLDDGSRYPHTGQLTFADALVDPSTSSVTLRAVFPNPDHLLLPGMYVKAQLAQGANSDAILAPQQGITRNPRGQATALVVTRDNTVEQRQVTVDGTVGSRWIVTTGLKAGDRLVVEGLQRAKPGSTVRAVEFKPANTDANKAGK